MNWQFALALGVAVSLVGCSKCSERPEMPSAPQVVDPQHSSETNMAPGAISGATIPEQPKVNEAQPAEVEGDTLSDQLPDTNELNQDLPPEE